MTDTGIRRRTSKQERMYDIPGYGMFPSVTTVLQVVAKPALVPWAKKISLEKVRSELTDVANDFPHVVLEPEWIDEMLESARKRPDQVRDEAGDIGTRAHGLIEAYLKGEMTEETHIPDDLSQAFDNFLNWQTETDLEFRGSEIVVWDEKAGYAGTLDILAENNDGYVIIDIKTGSGIYPEMSMQVAAYSMAWQWRNPEIPVSTAYVVRLGKNEPDIEVKEVDVLKGMEGFRGALQLWKALNRKEELFRDV